MQHRKRLLRANRKPLDFFDQVPAIQSNQSNVLDAIKNQDLYLKIVGIALQVSRQAGVSESALEEMEGKLLAAKGYQEYSMLSQDKNQQICRVEHQNKNFSYSSSKKYITPQEQLAFLAKMEKQVIEVQAKQHVIYALKKYIEQKMKTINDNPLRPTHITRANAFLQKAKARSSQKKLQRCNFYGLTLRQIFGRIETERAKSYEILKRMIHLKTVWGHTFFSEAEEEYCPVYNVIFDNTEKLIITGGEDGKIKVWSRDTGSLLSTLQGHKDYINKICVSKDNKTILSAAQDGVRFFDLGNMNSLGGYKAESIMDIGEVINDKTNTSSVIFANLKKLYVLPMQTIRNRKNGKIQTYDFKIYNFGSRLHESSVNTTTLTITPEGMVFLGFSEGQIIMFNFNKLHEAKIDQTSDTVEQFQLPITCVLNAHEGDVLEIKWNPYLSCFSTGAKKDGVCKIWQFKLDEPERRPQVVKELKIPKYKMKRKKKMYNCNFGCWNSALTHLTCSFEEQEEGEESENRGDGEVLVYNAMKMQITWEMSKTTNLSSIRAMDSHPFYPNVMVICDSYGKVLIADIFENCLINVFEERAFHLNHPSFCMVPSECRFSQDGLALLVATQYGNYSIYGYDIKEFYQIYPTEQLFQNDYEDFHIDPLTFKPVLQVDAPVDVNDLDSGALQNMRHQPYKNLNKINARQFIKTMDNPSNPLNHYNAYSLDTEEVEKIGDCLQQYEKYMQIFKQNVEEIQGKRMSIFYDERQARQKIQKEIINEKLARIKQVNQISVSLFATSDSSNSGTLGFSQHSHIEENQPQQTTTTRRRGRRPTREATNPTSIARRSYVPYQENSSGREDENSNVGGIHDEEEQEYEAEGENEADELHQFEDEDEDEDQYDDDNSENQSEDVYLASRSRKRRIRANRASRRIQRNSNAVRTSTRRPAKDEIEELQQDFELELGKMRKRQFQNNQQNDDDIEEPQESPKNEIRKAASRAINQVPRQRNSCNLCLFKESTVSCFHCKKKNYCDGCKNFRGKRQSNRYICFQCFFTNNTSPENHKNISCEKYVAVERTDLFIPQVGDEVVYFFQGYEEFLYDKIEILNNKFIELEGEFDIVPHENHPELINVQKCEVTKIQFAFPLEQQSQPSYKNMNNRRGRVQKSSAQDILAFVTLKSLNGEFRVFFSPGYEYLIKWEIYDDIMKNDRYGKFRLYDIVKIKSEQIQIEQVRPLNQLYSNSIWKNIIVHKSQTKYLRTREKTQDIAINIWSIDGLIDESAFKYRSTFSQASRENFQAEIQKVEGNEPGIWEIFYHPVDTTIYPNYHNFVEVGMCLELILERLKSNYYASQKSFEADVRLLTVNSISFNSKENSITAMSQKLVRLILEGENYQNNLENQNSTEKKTKPKRKFNSGSSIIKDNEDEEKGKKKSDIKVSRFSQQNQVAPTRRLKKIRYYEKNSDDDYKQQSEENYEAEIESSQVKPATRNRRRQETHVMKKQSSQGGRVTRSRTKN